MRPKDQKHNKHIYSVIDGTWTLFLDRDGVINKKIDHDYVRAIDQFVFLPGAIDAIVGLSNIFGRIIVVTNQQGIDKGLMTHEDVNAIHDYMIDMISDSGGYIDQVYYCPELAHMDSPFRKPNVGMAVQAQVDFPDIDFRKSIMVGDSESDMEFGRKLDMVTVRIAPAEDKNADFTHATLQDFVLYLNNV